MENRTKKAERPILLLMSDSSDLDNLFTSALEDVQDTGSGMPDFSDLFSDTEDPFTGEEPWKENSKDKNKVQPTFAKIEQVLEDPKPVITESYYQGVLTGEGDISKRVHQLLGAFLKATDPQDRAMHRGRLAPSVMDLRKSIAGKTGQAMPVPKKYMLRFALLLPTMISPEQRKLISQVPEKNNTGEPIYYQDEWLREVAFGRVNNSATDETKVAARNQAGKTMANLERARGKVDAQSRVIENHVLEMKTQESILTDAVRRITYHDSLAQNENFILPYNDVQKSSFSEISTVLRQLSIINRNLSLAYDEFNSLQDQLRALEEQAGNMDVDSAADTKAAAEEMNTLAQMAKLSVGRQGNHFPLLYKQYFHGNIRDMGTREQVINTLADIEFLDPGIFLRTFKQQTNRIVPNIILIPCYGEFGVCWEPFEKFNRATSRGRLAIPMYPKDLRIAVIAALGDLRWQVAKEKAQHYWMEEGLTGWYYQWFSDKKMKGDVKDQFIQDYILWISKESEGTQKLEREVRDIFWRYMPFPQSLKDTLKNRGFVYAELYKKDQNRAMSDGY